MIGCGSGSKFRLPQHTSKRLTSYTSQKAKANIKYKGLQGEIERKAEKRIREQEKQGYPSPIIVKSKSQLRLAKQASEAFKKVREANVGIAKHTIRSNLATSIVEKLSLPYTNTNTIHKDIESLKTTANEKLKLEQAQANFNIAKKELTRKENRPKQKDMPYTQSMIQLKTKLASASKNLSKFNSKLQIQAVKNTLRALPKNSKEKTHAESRLAHYAMKKIKAIADKKKADVDLNLQLNLQKQRQLTRQKEGKSTNPNPIYTSSMKKLAKKSSRANTKSKQYEISIEKHKGRLNQLRQQKLSLLPSTLPLPSKLLPTPSKLLPSPSTQPSTPPSTQPSTLSPPPSTLPPPPSPPLSTPSTQPSTLPSTPTPPSRQPSTPISSPPSVSFTNSNYYKKINQIEKTYADYKKLKQKISIAVNDNRKKSLESNKQTLKKQLNENTKIIQNYLKSVPENEKTNIIKFHPHVYYGQLISQEKKKNTGETEEQIKSRLLKSNNEEAIKIIKLVNQAKIISYTGYIERLKQEIKTPEEISQIEKEIEKKYPELDIKKQHINSIKINLKTKEEELKQIKEPFNKKKIELNEQYAKQLFILKNKELETKPTIETYNTILQNPNINNDRKTIIQHKKTELLSPFNQEQSSLYTNYLKNYNNIEAEEKKATNDLDNTIVNLLIAKEESVKDFNRKTQDIKNYESQITESTKNIDSIEYATKEINQLNYELELIKNP